MRTLVFGLGAVAGGADDRSARSVGNALLAWLFALLGRALGAWAGRAPSCSAARWRCRSTAIVVKLMAERLELDSEHGRRVIGVLLFQDLAVVPLLVLIPALGSGAGRPGRARWPRAG